MKTEGAVWIGSERKAVPRDRGAGHEWPAGPLGILALSLVFALPALWRCSGSGAAVGHDGGNGGGPGGRDTGGDAGGAVSRDSDPDGARDDGIPPFTAACGERPDVTPSYEPYLCTGNVGCNPGPCRACSPFCRLCDGEWCVLWGRNDDCEPGYDYYEGFWEGVPAHAVWLDGVAGQFSFDSCFSLTPADAKPPAEARWEGAGGQVETRALASPVTLVTEAVLLAGIVTGSDRCGGDAPPDRIGPDAIPVWYPSPQGCAPVPTLQLSVAWIRVWADQTGAVVFQWYQPAGTLEVPSYPPAVDAVATAPFPAEVATPIANAWPYADGSSYDWAAALAEFPAMVCHRLGVPLVLPDMDSDPDGTCDVDLFFDRGCHNRIDLDLDPGCGREFCAAGPGCQAYEACGAPHCFEWEGRTYATVRPCPNDAGCSVSAGGATVPCQRDDQCDPACPVFDGVPLDPDCVGHPDAGAWCPGGSRYEECQAAGE